ncbi:MAG: histidine phosphatase family protein, partial [Planctomycetaceae bacterium]
VLQGSMVDNPLSPTGERQAAAVAEFLKNVPVAAVYCSRLARAMQTAGAIARHQNLDPTPLDAIHEIDVGQWEGLSWAAIQERHRDSYDAFIASPGTVAYLGGESYAHVLTRAEPVFTALLQRHLGQTIVVVAHNVVNRAYLARLLGLDINLAKNIEQTNTCINVIEYDAEKNRATVATLNAAFHVPGVFDPPYDDLRSSILCKPG